MPQPKAALHRVLRLAKFLLDIAAGGAAIATLVGFAGSLWWVFGLLDHPRPQYGLILVSAIVVGGISRRAWSFLWCLPLVLNLVLIVPLFFSLDQSSTFKAQANPTVGSTLRIVHANLDRDNEDPTQAIQYLETQNVDLMLLQEITPKWLTTLQSALPQYRVVASEPRENSQGSAILVPVTASKSVEVVATQTLHLPSWSERPMVEATIRWEGLEVAILSLQVTRPRNRDTSDFQQVEFDAVADWSLRQQKQNKRQVVVIGDFNSTPWSGRFRSFLHNSALRNSQRGFGLQPTWRAGLPSVLMIAIDHCLHSKGITTINRATGLNIGSDHLPLFVELRSRNN